MPVLMREGLLKVGSVLLETKIYDMKVIASLIVI